MTAPVSFISPLSITSSMITSSTAVKKLAGEAEWSATGDYVVGTVVFRTTLGRRFENQIPGVNATPPEDDQDRWYDLGATDKTTMFDSEVSTESIASDILTVVFRPGAFNAMFLAGIRDGATLEITAREAPGGPVYFNHFESLEDSEPADYYEYYYSGFKPKTDFLVTDLHPFASCEVTISIANPGGAVGCGMACLGDLVSVGGPALRGVTVEPKSYARITTDDRGKTRVKKGKAARDLTASALVPREMADEVTEALEGVLGVPSVWLVTNSRTSRTLRSFGLGKGKLTYDKVDYATLNLTVEGMI